MGTTVRSWIARPILNPDFTDDPPLEDVYVGVLKQKKDISTAIQSISSILPGFQHLKRCSSNRLLLAPLNCTKIESAEMENSSEKCILTEDELKIMLREKGFDLSLLEDNFQILKVPARRKRKRLGPRTFGL